MEEMREKRLKQEFAALVNRRKLSALAVLRTFKNTRLPETEVMPQGPDFCHFPVISEVLNQTADVEVDESSFNDAIPLLPEVIAEWRDSIKRKMMQVIKKEDTSRRNRLCDYMDQCEFEFEAPPVGPNSHLTDEELSQKLTRASTVFTCECCHNDDDYNDYPNFFSSDDEDDCPRSKILFFPQVMGHSCVGRAEKKFWEFSPTPDPSRRLDSGRKDRKQWDSSELSVLTTASRNARHIIRLAGLDPDLATSAEMDQLKIRFVCCVCSSMTVSESDDEEEELFPTFDWRGAVSRDIQNHFILYRLYLSYRLTIGLTIMQLASTIP